eukprot:CAMPEP_0176208148 /NCGR_PEP_ID=MMETSP0121_2-20121125/12972_1 /TAXON_ID=160619 /ORGANISM="Kryptoperidinium foliaceum, Strain CCMP 1326" /LENGTH=484 /DNA_ID=CAMNT_0017547127 /DNA_START=16 /DNA_END=1470 /DNA_ORIENTATION=+
MRAIIFGHSFMREHEGKLTDVYELGKPLGEGSYGQVTMATHKTLKQVRALKAIDRSNIADAKRLEEEIKIQQSLSHPNIVRLFEVFNDFKKVYLVMELCTGGELFERIVAEAMKHRGTALQETDAARYMRQIMRAIHYLHGQCFVHRDIKPENFLLEHKGDDAEIKVIDFGLARRFKPGSGEFMRTKVGTPFYVAPQVLQGRYDEKCDIWSTGVILYVLLCGYPPFSGERDLDVLRAVKRGKFEFRSPHWDKSSRSVKDVITQMLTYEPSRRPDAGTVLEHTWFASTRASALEGGTIIDADLASKLRAFREGSRMRKIALTIIATQLGNQDLKLLKNTFEEMDANNDGTLTAREIKAGMLAHKVEVPDDLDVLIQRLDTDGSGGIDYSEFIAATMTRAQYMREDVLWGAFRTFDVDGNGVITQEEVIEVLQNAQVCSDLIDNVVAELNTGADGISFEEFCKVLDSEPLPIVPSGVAMELEAIPE